MQLHQHRLVAWCLTIVVAIPHLANAEQPAELSKLTFEQGFTAAAVVGQVRKIGEHGPNRSVQLACVPLCSLVLCSPFTARWHTTLRRLSLQVERWIYSGMPSPSAQVDAAVLKDFMSQFALLRGDPVATLATADKLELIGREVRQARL